MNAVKTDSAEFLKLNLCAGNSRMDGYLSVDQFAFDGLDVVSDLREPWPWNSDSVSDIHLSHALEHFTAVERVHVFNEMYRVLIPGGKATIITPHWNSNRAYGDFTHQWPPVSEMLYYYLSREWRKTNAPHTDAEWNAVGYKCDFEATWGYSMHPEIAKRNTEYQQYAMSWYKEACQDLHATLTARK